MQTHTALSRVSLNQSGKAAGLTQQSWIIRQLLQKMQGAVVEVPGMAPLDCITLAIE